MKTTIEINNKPITPPITPPIILDLFAKSVVFVDFVEFVV